MHCKFTTQENIFTKSFYRRHVKIICLLLFGLQENVLKWTVGLIQSHKLILGISSTLPFADWACAHIMWFLKSVNINHVPLLMFAFQ